MKTFPYAIALQWIFLLTACVTAAPATHVFFACMARDGIYNVVRPLKKGK